MFADRIVTPSFVDDVRDATLDLLARDVPSGLFHCVNSGQGTWADVGRHVADLVGADPGLLALTSVNDVRLRARRPVYCALSNREARRRDREAVADVAGCRRPLRGDACGRGAL